MSSPVASAKEADAAAVAERRRMEAEWRERDRAQAAQIAALSSQYAALRRR
eukprot:gene1923-1265_t